MKLLRSKTCRDVFHAHSVRRAELRVRCSSDLPRHPSAAKVRNLIRIQKRRNDIQEIAYRLPLVETF
jgi:hypothetical protein